MSKPPHATLVAAMSLRMPRGAGSAAEARFFRPLPIRPTSQAGGDVPRPPGAQRKPARHKIPAIDTLILATFRQAKHVLRGIRNMEASHSLANKRSRDVPRRLARRGTDFIGDFLNSSDDRPSATVAVKLSSNPTHSRGTRATVAVIAAFETGLAPGAAARTNSRSLRQGFIMSSHFASALRPWPRFNSNIKESLRYRHHVAGRPHSLGNSARLPGLPTKSSD